MRQCLATGPYIPGDRISMSESGGDPGCHWRDPGPGGHSYGAFQFTTGQHKPGCAQGSSLEAFLQSDLGAPFARQGLDPARAGSDEFTDLWRQVADADPTAFKEAQREFVWRHYIDAAIGDRLKRLKLDIRARSCALQELVMHLTLAAPALAKTALRKVAEKHNGDLSDVDDAILLKELHQVRSRPNPKVEGGLFYWRRNSPRIQRNVRRANEEEYQDLVLLLELEVGP